MPIRGFRINDLVHGLDPHPVRRTTDPDEMVGEFTHTFVRTFDLFRFPLVEGDTDYEFHGGAVYKIGRDGRDKPSFATKSLHMISLFNYERAVDGQKGEAIEHPGIRPVHIIPL